MIDKIPKFRQEYQIWYSKSKILIKQLLPDRLDDFVRYYEKPRSRKNVSVDNYTIEDYLQGLGVTQADGTSRRRFCSRATSNYYWTGHTTRGMTTAATLHVAAA